MTALSSSALKRAHGKVGAQASAARAQAERIARDILGSEEGDVSVARVRERTKEAVGQVLSVRGSAAAEAAAALYDLTMQAEGLEVAPADVTWSPDADQIDRVVRYQARHLVDGDADAFVTAVGDYAEDATVQAARDTTTSNVDRDRDRGVRYARVLNEGEYTCEWCVLLASRGFVYSSEDAAAAGSHRGCNCDIEAGVAGQTSIRGVDLDRLKTLEKTSKR